MKQNGHKIRAVLPGGIAEEMGVEPGMTLVSINGQAVEDVFDYRYLMSGEYLDVLIREESGEETLLEIEKDPDEEFGVEFESSLMDDYKSCRNKCIFCFIDQMPKGMRETLYFKDDDSRLSFLQGNYVTLTNMSDYDIDRIIRYRMEPINISVQTTNPELRCRMLNNRFAGDVFPKIQKLHEHHIHMNGQIVLCKGFNDGEELDRSIRDLTAYLPEMQSVSVVPVGLSKYRDGLEPLAPFTKEDAEAVIDLIENWQKKLYDMTSEKANSDDPDAADWTPSHFIHASDEWYLLAERPLPEAAQYDGYIQYENGVGMLRLLEEEVTSFLEDPDEDVRSLEGQLSERKITIATGRLAGPYLRSFAGFVRERYPHISVNVTEIRNCFFGESITVSGLITGQDLIGQLKEKQRAGEDLGEELLIPVNMLRSGEEVFLDDLTLTDVRREIGLPVRVVWEGGDDFVRALLGLPHVKEEERQTYE